MLNTFSLLLLYQLIGEIVARLAHLPVPGPVIGMILFFLTLLIKKSVSDEIKSGTSVLLQHLSLLFVPAGTGVMLYLERVGSEFLPIVVSLIASTFIGLAVTALVLKLMTRKSPSTEKLP